MKEKDFRHHSKDPYSLRFCNFFFVKTQGIVTIPTGTNSCRHLPSPQNQRYADGKTDELIPPADVEAIRAAYPDLPIYMYDAGHAFVAPNGFHEDSARLSKLRTLAFFSRNSGMRGES